MGFQFNQVGGGTKTRRPVALRMQYNPACTEPVCYLGSKAGKEQRLTLAEVQAFIEGELKKLRGAEGLAPIMDVVSAYHLARGATLEKIVKKPTSSSDEETKVEVDEGKTTTKKTTSTKQSSAQSAPLPDYVKCFIKDVSTVQRSLREARGQRDGGRVGRGRESSRRPEACVAQLHRLHVEPRTCQAFARCCSGS